MYNPWTTALIHPVINYQAAGGVRARPPSSVDPRRYPRPVRRAPHTVPLIHPILPAGLRVRARPGLSLGPAELDLVATARAAADWIKGKIRKFFDLERKLSLEFHQAAQLEGAAKAAGNLQAASEAGLVREAAFALLLDYDEVKTRLEDLVARVPGLGVIPIAVLIAAGSLIIGLSITMAAVFRRETALEKSLDLVAAGVLTPAEADKLTRERSGTLFGGIGLGGGIGGLVALTVAIAVGLPILSDALLPPRRAA